MTETITFYYDLEEGTYEGSITPSSQMVPEWYKQIPRVFAADNGAENPSVKHCIPFIEALTSGYLVLTPEDYVVEKKPLQGRTIASDGDSLNKRNVKDTGGMPVPEGYDRIHHTWKHKLYIDIPEGYSILFTQPLNRFDVPFITLSAIVDGPYMMPSGGIAFCIRDDFEGTIPAGTPYAQMIPFKTQDFIMEKKETLAQETKDEFRELFKTTKNYTEEWISLKNKYRTKSWNKKSYKLKDNKNDDTIL